jgi:predicted transposase YdaD
VDTDRPIKVLFERQGQSLLPFIGERRTDVRVTAVESVELPVATRRIDSVLRLERDGLVWYRHLEFQSGPDPDMPRRCFEYNSRLILHYDAAVLTTVLYLFPGSDRDAKDAFRLYIGDQIAYEWRFDVVRLWEIDAQSALQNGEAGPLALVPLLRGGDEPQAVLEAVRRLDALPRAESADAMSALLDFASQRYDRATFWNVLGKDRVMESWLWQLGRDEGEARGRAEGEARGRAEGEAQGRAEGEAQGRAEGEAQGRAEGEAQAIRRICVDLSRECHPRAAARVLPVIEACVQPETLRAWVLQCPKLSDAEFVALVTGQPPKHVTRSRTSRPSRTSRRPAPPRKRR